MLDLTHIKALIHDWDDTIVRSFETYLNWYFEFAKYFELESPDTVALRAVWGRKIDELILAAWPNLQSAKVWDMFTEFRQSDLFTKSDYIPKPFPGIKKTLSYFHKSNYVFGVLSSAHKPSFIETYTRYFSPTLHFHDFIYTHEDHVASKPDPRCFDEVVVELANRGISESEAIYVGDSLFDYFAARDRGLFFVAVTTGLTDEAAFVDAGMDKNLVLESFNKLPAFLYGSHCNSK